MKEFYSTEEEISVLYQVCVGAEHHAALSTRTLEGQVFCVSGTNHMEVDTAGFVPSVSLQNPWTAKLSLIPPNSPKPLGTPGYLA